VLPEHDAWLRGQPRWENRAAAQPPGPDVVVVMTDGLAVLAAWCEFGVLVACLAFVVLRGNRAGR